MADISEGADPETDADTERARSVAEREISVVVIVAFLSVCFVGC
ncbi:MAG: hypothetical protein ACJAR2_004146 [Ilumatobacter sp.]|jgi:hypothetical protein